MPPDGRTDREFEDILRNVREGDLSQASNGLKSSRRSSSERRYSEDALDRTIAKRFESTHPELKRSLFPDSYVPVYTYLISAFVAIIIFIFYLPTDIGTNIFLLMLIGLITFIAYRQGKNGLPLTHHIWFKFYGGSFTKSQIAGTIDLIELMPVPIVIILMFVWMYVLGGDLWTVQGIIILLILVTIYYSNKIPKIGEKTTRFKDWLADRFEGVPYLGLITSCIWIVLSVSLYVVIIWIIGHDIKETAPIGGLLVPFFRRYQCHFMVNYYFYLHKR
jgi:hypothetical protein